MQIKIIENMKIVCKVLFKELSLKSFLLAEFSICNSWIWVGVLILTMLCRYIDCYSQEMDKVMCF